MAYNFERKIPDLDNFDSIIEQEIPDAEAENIVGGKTTEIKAILAIGSTISDEVAPIDIFFPPSGPKPVLHTKYTSYTDVIYDSAINLRLELKTLSIERELLQNSKNSSL